VRDAYYERIELLPAPQRVSGQRRYDASVLRRSAVDECALFDGRSLRSTEEGRPFEVIRAR